MFTFQDLAEYVSYVPGIVIAVTVHEYVKAMVSAKLGDPNPKKDGRLSPNPLKHMDMLGAIFMLLRGYGWANPVKLQPTYYKDRKKGILLVFFIPMLVNIIIGLLFGFGAMITFKQTVALDSNWIYYLYLVMYHVARFNLTFAFFNIIPIYPLDGNKLLGVFSPLTALKISQNEKILQVVLSFFIILGFAGVVFDPLFKILLGFIK